MAEAAPSPLRVAVGSKNPVKLAAVRQAFFRAFPDRPLVCVGHDVPSGVSDQPWGHPETRLGAIQRRRGAFTADMGADYAVGIEGGVVDTGAGGHHDIFTAPWISRAAAALAVPYSTLALSRGGYTLRSGNLLQICLLSTVAL